MRVILAGLPGLFFAIALQAADVTKGEFKAAAPPTDTPAAKTRAKPHSEEKSYPFSGVIASAESGSIVLKGKTKNRVILLTSETRIERNGTATTFADAKTGEKVSGTVRKNAAGKEEAVKVYLGGRSNSGKASAPK
ncbi:MAG TPA: hypothetical protein VGR78_00065 [Verrucomicrobiae bacterium]|jgi:hypothetical protein|nr:hypothetical protein [Verrucomicrobiae bacterium]